MPAAVLSTLLAVAAGTFVAVAVAGPAYAEPVAVGAGSYRSGPPPGAAGPSDATGAPTLPKVTAAAAARPVPTGDWWSSLIWQRSPANPHSENMYADPLSFHARPGGLGVGYPNGLTITGDGRTYEYLHHDDLVVGVDGLNAPRTLVDAWSDWTVSPWWPDGTRWLRVTIGHGLPYVYAQIGGGAARVGLAAAPDVWHHAGNVLGITVRDHDYALFAPTGRSWTVSPTAATADSAAYVTVALLPARDALGLFTTYAFAAVADTRVGWRYDPVTAELTTTYTAITTALEGDTTGTLLALYPHQWCHSTDPLTGYRYSSSRGELRLHEGAQFTTRLAFTGVVSALPAAADADTARLANGIDAVLAQADPFQGATDTYWTGKALWRLAALVPIADQIGRTETRDRLLSLVRDRLTDWLTAADTETTRLFAYHSGWTTLIGYPAAYGSDTELNDHHFDYGYFVLATATLARYDPAWATDARYGAMVKLLIKDVANTDRTDARFPFLRTLDPYQGHSWASGHAGFAAGDNQESSSEAMTLATGMILFAAATGDTALRDTDIYLYATEQTAIGEYWFDTAHQVHPPGYPHHTLGIVWGDGGAYATWWSSDPEYIHGINMLPITTGSLYHGAWKPAVLASVEELRTSKGGSETQWQDVIWSFLAIADPAQALTRLNTLPYTPEWGETRAHTYHWISALAYWGTPDPTVTADLATYAVLTTGQGRTYIADNPSCVPVTAHFTDGTVLQVPAGAMVWRGLAGTGTRAGACTSVPSTVTIGPAAAHTPAPEVGPWPGAGGALRRGTCTAALPSEKCRYWSAQEWIGRSSVRLFRCTRPILARMSSSARIASTM
ncbi:glycosyl hydrolase [Krasilnikovia cinnamomea]|uniref:glycosyl hydrolase n=1 Tax=Krasilnikovia cinnamomea TaxID=349313 RepID=UPI0013EF5AC6|nr:glycosyl hydrolase [Krasilnikovia cinnamomea]